jgi:hypothetical protein
MFGLGNKNKSLKKFLNENDFQAENIPIHTMLRDLESEKNAPKEEGQPEIPQDFETSSAPEPQPPAPPASSPNRGEPASPELQPAPPSLGKRGETVPVPATLEPADRRASSPFLSADLISDITKNEPKPRVENVTQNAPELVADVSPAQQAQQFFSGKPANPGGKKELFINAGEEMPGVPKAEQKATPGNLAKKLVLILLPVLLLVSALAGGYYFWISKKKSETKNNVPQEIVSEKQPELPTENKNYEPPIIASSKFSSTERNFFMIDLSSGSASAFRSLANNYFEEIKVLGIAYPVEFTVIDPGNSTVSFRTFAEKLGLKFSLELLSALEPNFNLYIYNDRGEPGIGLSVKVKSGTTPEEILLKEESNLPGELAPIFPMEEYSIQKGAPFSTGEYDSARWGKVAIRYYNIPAAKNLSVDYSFHNAGEETLFIGTTKNTLRAIIENIE